MWPFKRQQKDQPNKLTLEANGLIEAPVSEFSDSSAITGPATTILNENTPIVSAAGSNPEIIPQSKTSDHKRKLKLGAIIVGGVIGGVLALLALLTVTGVDLVVMQPFLTGKVTSDGQPVAGATVKVGVKTATTDAVGDYKVEGITPGFYDVEVVAPKFAKLVERIDITRNYLSYQNTKNFEVSLEGLTTARGKITVADAAYNFSDDRIIIADQRLELNKDGSFQIPNAPIGRQTWQYQSANYVDVSESFLFKERTTNELGEFKVNPAGDLIASTVSYLTGQVVTDLQVTVEGVNPQQVTISSEGILKIRDLEIAKQYRVDIAHNLYVSRRYTATTKQGESEILNFRVVEKGKVAFARASGNQSILVATDYDGENLVQLTPTSYNPILPYVDGTQVYFLSNKDSASSNTGDGRISIPYVASLAGGSPLRVTNEYTNIGQIEVNFKARKFVNFRRGANNSSRVVEIADIDGTNRLPIFDGTGIVVNDMQLADNGKAVAFVLAATDTTGGLYWSNIENKARILAQRNNIVASDISPSGDRVLYLNNNAQTGVTDLYMFIVSEGKDVLLRTGWKGQQVQFYADSESDIVFFELRDGTNNMFKVDLNDNKETRLTTFSSGESVESITQQPGLIVYQTNKGLYSMNVQKPLPGKLVTTNYTRVSAN